MANSPNEALNYAHQNREKFLEELKSFVKIPSVSTDPVHKSDIQQAANWVAERLKGLGMQNVSLLPTKGHPAVYGESLAAGEQKPIVLIYGHYDVQPADPLELWLTPPFEPTQKGENLFGRGASDMKGQIVISLKAVESILQTGDLPFNIKFIIEGEEEIGSPNLEKFILENSKLLSCDFVINPDGGIIAPDTPSITYGLRGLAYFELNISGPNHDLHSGIFGGAVHNPAQVLCELIAGMHDENGRITLPGYYDDVRPLEDDERVEIARLPIDEVFFKEQTGAPALYGEVGYSSSERVGVRPTLEVNGLFSGFTGEGSKTVLPCTAMAKLSMRLVPDQDPTKVHQQLKAYLEENAPATVTWELVPLAGAFASITDRKMPAVTALAQAFQDVWGTKPVFKREGGTVPVVAQMQKILKADSVLTGFGLPDDNLHAPNEKIHLPTFYRGIDTFIKFFTYLGD
jgi:acetylornithine deacetylase/succinyl-diaminopimelate desuccinylase-like protein